MVQGHWAKRPMSSIIRGRLNQGREVLKKKRKESTKRPQCAQLTRKQHQQQHCPRAHSEYSLRKQKREIEKEFVTILYFCVLFQPISQNKQATAAMSHDGHIKNSLSLSLVPDDQPYTVTLPCRLILLLMVAMAVNAGKERHSPAQSSHHHHQSSSKSEHCCEGSFVAARSLCRALLP